MTPETNAVATMILAFTIGMLLVGQLLLTLADPTPGPARASDMAAMVAEQSG